MHVSVGDGEGTLDNFIIISTGCPTHSYRCNGQVSTNFCQYTVAATVKTSVPMLLKDPYP